MEFEGKRPQSAPIHWVEEYLHMVAGIIPNLVYVCCDELICQMDLMYLQVVLLHETDKNDRMVLSVGQNTAWAIIDPLYSFGDEVGIIGRHTVGAIHSPQGVDDSKDVGFALMTWVREVFVYGKPIHEVKYRRKSDKEQCNFEVHFKCIFHP